MHNLRKKLKFDNLYIVSHQPGTLGDSLVAFLSLHQKQALFKIVGSRMRSTTPGILLNWGSYYKNWPQQQNDPNLYKQLNLQDNVSNFVQAHFFLKETEIIEKFPGSRAIRLLVEDSSNMEIYFKYLYQKLMSKTMYRAWYERYKKFAWLDNADTQQTLSNMCLRNTLRVKHYWAAWYMDNRGLSFDQIADPMSFWLEQAYVQDFHPNFNTMITNNQAALSQTNNTDIIDVYIDRLWPTHSQVMDMNEYTRLCESVKLVPDYTLAQSFWEWRKSSQPDHEKIKISRNWN